MKITPKAFDINSTKKNHPSSGRSMRPMSVTTNYSSRPMTTNPTNNRLTSGGPNINSSNNLNSSHISSKSNQSRDPSISSSSQEDSYENFKYIYQNSFAVFPLTLNYYFLLLNLLNSPYCLVSVNKDIIIFCIK